jgi:hypothetical protein
LVFIYLLTLQDKVFYCITGIIILHLDVPSILFVKINWESCQVCEASASGHTPSNPEEDAGDRKTTKGGAAQSAVWLWPFGTRMVGKYL